MTPQQLCERCGISLKAATATLRKTTQRVLRSMDLYFYYNLFLNNQTHLFRYFTITLLFVSLHTYNFLCQRGLVLVLVIRLIRC